MMDLDLLILIFWVEYEGRKERNQPDLVSLGWFHFDGVVGVTLPLSANVGVFCGCLELD